MKRNLADVKRRKALKKDLRRIRADECDAVGNEQVLRDFRTVRYRHVHLQPVIDLPQQLFCVASLAGNDAARDLAGHAAVVESGPSLNTMRQLLVCGNYATKTGVWKGSCFLVVSLAILMFV